MSILGYSLLPLTFLSAINIILELRTFYGMPISLGFSIWATLAATSFLTSYLELHHKKWLVSYPVFLFYITFVLITIF